jgi:indolepyruvate ferredoxin oxidoreductase alpha subunit
VLCPSFYRAEIINNPSGWDRFKGSLRGAVIGWLQTRIERRLEGLAA